jgi:hypothetical protein
MNKDTIYNMISNSTWVCKDNHNVFKFSSGNSLSINGKNHLQYSLIHLENRIVIQMGAEESYYVDFIDDFTLCFYNNNERFRITPE